MPTQSDYLLGNLRRLFFWLFNGFHKCLLIKWEFWYPFQMKRNKRIENTHKNRPMCSLSSSLTSTRHPSTSCWLGFWSSLWTPLRSGFCGSFGPDGWFGWGFNGWQTAQSCRLHCFQWVIICREEAQCWRFLWVSNIPSKGSSNRVFKKIKIFAYSHLGWFEPRRIRWCKPFFVKISFLNLLPRLKFGHGHISMLIYLIVYES